MKGLLLSMKLFDETENKYIELLSYLVNWEEGMTESDIKKAMMDLNEGELDYPLYEALFSKNEGESTIFKFNGMKFEYMFKSGFPIRLNKIEQEALFSLTDIPYAGGFINAETLKKIEDIAYDQMEVSVRDVEIKNQNSREKSEDLLKKIAVLLSALKCSGRVVFDNVNEGKYVYKNSCVWPVKLEYSFVNDMFRLCAFSPEDKRFIKIRLDTMKNVSCDNTPKADLEKEYIEFMRNNSKTVVLEVDPVQHVIERCFRLFSFYDRKAVYDSDKEKYRLELSYYRFDESEVLRDIMSLGSNVIVIEPRGIQIKIYNRMVAARKRYSV